MRNYRASVTGFPWFLHSIEYSSKLDFIFDALSMEIMALKHGLEVAQNVGCNRILCCSDSLDGIQAMQDGGYSNRAATILDDFYHLATEFSKIHFEHNYGEPNSVAHEIARYTRSNDQQVWLDEAPDFIVPLLVKDVKLIMNE
jgi:hypothetical protein